MKIPSIVNVQWLAQAVLRKNPLKHLRILDGTWRLKESGSEQAKKDFLDEHIPGAVFFDIDECCDKSSSYSHMIPDEKLFAEYARHLGMTLDILPMF
jgi:thiosulfate/3-mercaptopyruvate sulfurtransferase